jgi:predicted ABC-type ATPase
VEKARSLGLLFWLVYVTTLDPELNVERVWDRVQAGGHDVPSDAVRQRWHRSMDELTWFAARADKLIVVDNSLDTLSVLALRRYNGPLEFTGAMPGHPALHKLAQLQGKPVESATGHTVIAQ